jgi:hypothetical protein
MKKPDILAALDPVMQAFEKIGVPYYIGGSIASSAFGIARATLDVDLIADLTAHNALSLVKMLKNDYYIDEEMILNAIHKHSSFNIIHLETMIKLDIFVPEDTPYKKAVFERRRKDTLEEKEGAKEYHLTSPEDVILNKLVWFDKGEQVSERQWRDVLGVLKVQADALDKEYLLRWAAELGIAELLKKAFSNADIHE